VLNSILSNLPAPFFVLAPMDNVTDTVFRQVISSCAKPDIFFTEFVNVDGLQSVGRDKILKKLVFSSQEKPLFAQLWGLEPDNFYKTAQELVEMGFDGIDLNFGCPERTVVKSGAGAAIINNRKLAVEIIKATQAGASGRGPISVKTRLGFSDIDLSWHELLLKQNLDILTIHGRTRREMSKVPVHWEQVGNISQLRDSLAPNTLIIGNGDVQSRSQGLELAAKYRLDGIMIGRSVFNDPFVFATSSPWEDFPKVGRIELYKKHIRLFSNTWRSDERPIYSLNKFCKVYINGFDGAKELREKLMAVSTIDELLVELDKAMLKI